MKRMKKKPAKKIEFDKKKLDKLIGQATVDCYTDDEADSGVMITVAEEMVVPFTATIFGEKISVFEIEEDDNRVIAKFKKGSKTQWADIRDLRDVRPLKNRLWLAVYKKWLGGEY